jgi:hypothetical protein
MCLYCFQEYPFAILNFLSVFIVFLSIKQMKTFFMILLLLLFIVFLFTAKQMKIKEIHGAEMKQTSLF